jgi:cytochrome c
MTTGKSKGGYDMNIRSSFPRRVAILLPLLTLAVPALAAAPESPADHAKRIVNEAVALIAKRGLVDACPVFNQVGGPFYQGQSYVFVLDFASIYRCYPFQPAAVGQDVSHLKDANGVLINREMLKVVRSPAGQGWVDYVWIDPLTKKLAPKVSFVERVPGQDLFVGSGYYK